MNSILISLKNIKKRYGNTVVLKNISFNLHQGEIISLLGVNGAGKSTLSSIIATLHPPTEGNIIFQEQSVYNDIPSFRKMVGYCVQKPNLNSLLTVEKNLYFAGKYFGISDEAIEQRLTELNEHLGIKKYLHYLPSKLSGGWKQRYMIARTLMHKPKLVILDEPTVALDPDIRYQLWYYIKHLRDSGVTVLLTTHYLEEAEALSDRICLLHKGEIKLIDTPHNLMLSFQKGKLEEVFLQLTKEQEDIV